MTDKEMQEAWLKNNKPKKCDNSGSEYMQDNFRKSKAHRGKNDYQTDPMWKEIKIKTNEGKEITFMPNQYRTNILNGYKSAISKDKLVPVWFYKSPFAGFGNVRENTIIENITNKEYTIIYAIPYS